MNKNKKILICPLNWGLGHAARCVPIIKEFVAQGAEVIIASEGNPLAFLKEEFPKLQLIEFNGYNINYGKKKNIAFKMFLSIPKILYGIYKEHKQLNYIINKHNIDVVISDNRFGCWNKKVKSIYITHQLMIKSNKYLMFMESILHKIHKCFINKYDECWIPDLKEGITLSGDLSHKFTSFNTPIYYIGILSRFNDETITNNTLSFEYDLMVILSGPEPQRSIFEELILEQLHDTYLKAIIVRGKPDKIELNKISDNITIYSHLNSIEFKEKLQSSARVLCRSGYSSLMDLAVLGKEAILVPTPGQTEQEYLAQYHYEKKHYYYSFQKDFNLMNTILKTESFKGLKLHNDKVLLKERIMGILNPLVK